MARDFIKVDRASATAAHSGLLIQTVDAVRRALELVQRVEGIIAHNNDGTNYADVEVLFGLPVGSGQTVSTLVGASIQNAASKQFTERVG